MNEPTEVEATVVATREQTDASLAEERDKTDVLVEAAAPAAGPSASAEAETVVTSERAETDRSLLAERNEVDEVVDEAKALLATEQRVASASKNLNRAPGRVSRHGHPQSSQSARHHRNGHERSSRGAEPARPTRRGSGAGPTES